MNNFLNYNINLHKYIYNKTFYNINKNINNNNINKNNKISINKISKILNTSYFKKLKQSQPKLSLETAGEWEKEYSYSTSNIDHKKPVIYFTIDRSSVPTLHNTSRIAW
jgi:hypothetical protein